MIAKMVRLSPILRKYWLLNLELAEVQTEQVFNRFGTKYWRMDDVKFLEVRQPLKNLKWYGLKQ